MLRTPRPLLAFCLAAAATASASAGVVEVSFIEPSRFADAGATPWDRESSLNGLADHLRSLGQRLPADQTLKIEVLDVDLAGETRPSARTGRELRILKGRADWPRIQLRYTLTSNGQALRSGAETVADMNYTQGFGSGGNAEPLYYEKRLLDGWFKRRFVDKQAD